MIPESGNWAIPPQFDDASLFSEGLAPVKLNRACGYIDRRGDFVLQPQFVNNAKGDCAVVSGHLSEGLSGWRIGNKFGYIDKSGAVVIKPKFDLTDHFSEDLAYVGVNGKWGFINKSGKLVIKPIYDRVDDFSGGLAHVVLNGGKHGYIDKTEKYIWEPAHQVNNAILGGPLKSGRARPKS